MKSLALTFSRQYGNAYAAGPSGSADTEGAWMRTLAGQVAEVLRAAGATVYLNPGIDINGDKTLSYRDEVAWSKQSPQSDADVLISLHSNAAGDACVLAGPSKASEALRAAVLGSLAKHCPMPNGDKWTPYNKAVGITHDSPQPAVLIEVGRHDQPGYAQWLREAITSGRLARALASAFLVVLGGKPIPTPAPDKTPTAAQLVQTIADCAAQLKEIMK